MLRHLGYTRAEIDAANDHVCGTMTPEGAPHLKEEHMHIFDCANPCGKKGKRYLSVNSHITAGYRGTVVHLGCDFSKRSTCQRCNNRRLSKGIGAELVLGTKANALYRDGSKLSQPLAAALIEDDEDAAEILETGTPQEKAVIAERSWKRL